eukprot:1855279-Rhodomonas_salina.5
MAVQYVKGPRHKRKLQGKQKVSRCQVEEEKWKECEQKWKGCEQKWKGCEQKWRHAGGREEECAGAGSSIR